LRRGTAAPPRRCPFGVICGTSAGAIHAAALACNADQFDATVEAMAQVWENFRVEQVYRADSLGVIRSGAQWLTALGEADVAVRRGEVLDFFAWPA
jgi:NTE family protein